MENQLAFDTTKSNMVAFNRCSCTCTDGCMSAQCECKQATLRQFCRRNNLSEAEAFEKGYPQSGWYKNDLLQGLDTQLPFQDQIQIFECSKGNAGFIYISKRDYFHVCRLCLYATGQAAWGYYLSEYVGVRWLSEYVVYDFGVDYFIQGTGTEHLTLNKRPSPHGVRVRRLRLTNSF